VTIEIILLALASSIRPTSLAAVYALLADDRRRALMCAYVAAGLVFTVGFGLIVVYALHGVHVNGGTNQTKGIAEIVGGLLALLFAGAVLTGHIRATPSQDSPDIGTRWQAVLSERLTLRTAALAGPITHIPGLFYLIALNVIVAHNPSVARKTTAVLTYNAVWFAVPILALVLCFLRPAAAQGAVRSIERWARERSRSILLVVGFGVGTALIVRGALTV
jgi:Sap, sulfolipid-1-addressing protein